MTVCLQRFTQWMLGQNLDFFFCSSLTTLQAVISDSDTVGKSALTGTLAVHASEDHRCFKNTANS